MPMKPLEPLAPIRPIEPMRPLEPLRPMQPMRPMKINYMQYCQYKESCRLQLHVSRHLNPFHPAYMHKKWCRKIDANRQWHRRTPLARDNIEKTNFVDQQNLRWKFCCSTKFEVEILLINILVGSHIGFFVDQQNFKSTFC